MANNLLVDWLNNKKNNVQTNVLRKSATNTNNVTTPNLPIKPTTVSQTGLNLQKAQQPVQTRLNNINTQTIPTVNKVGPAMMNGQPMTEDSLRSRFIGFQQPMVNSTGITTTQQQGKSFGKLMNGGYGYVPSGITAAETENYKEENRYRTMSEAFYDLQGTLYNRGKALSENEIRQKFPEFKDLDMNVLNELQNELLPIVRDGKGVDADQISQIYPELLKGKELKDIKGLKEQAKEIDKQYKSLRKGTDKALKSGMEGLSANGVKYARDADILFDAVTIAKKNVVGGASDSEILSYLINNNPKLKEISDEMNSLKLEDRDKAMFGMEDAGRLSKLYTNVVTDIFGTSDFQATNDEIETAIRAKEKLEGNFWENLANVGKTKIDTFGNTMKKAGYTAYQDAKSWGAKAAASLLPKSYYEKMLGVELTDEEYNNILQQATTEEVQESQQKALDYTDLINQRYQEKIDKNLDPDIENYYNNASATKLLLQGGGKGFAYKGVGSAAENIEMPATIALGVVAPEVVLPIMATDSFIRERQESREELIKAGASYEEAEEMSALVGFINAAIEVQLEKWMGGVETTASKEIRDIFMKDFTENATKSVAKRGIMDVIAHGTVTQIRSSFEEAAEEALQNTVQNLAIKNYDPDKKITEGLLQAVEGGFFNPMNLLAGGGEIMSNINRDTINQSAYNAGVYTRNITDAVDNALNKGAYNAGKGVRNLADLRNKVTSQGGTNNMQGQQQAEGENIPSNNNQNLNGDNNTENGGWSQPKQGVISKVASGIGKAYDATVGKVINTVAEKGAEVITDTSTPQDKLFQAVNPSLNKLTNKRGNYEQKRQNADRTNELIVEYGHTPTNSTEYYNALIKTKNALWKNEIQRGLDEHKYTTISSKELTDAVREEMQDDARFPLETNKSDLAKLNKELASLDRQGELTLEQLEAIKQQINAKLNYGKNAEAGEIYEKGLRAMNTKISQIEDQLIAKLPGEFTKFKKDYGALKDMEEDVLKMMLKDMKKKDGGGLTQNMGRLAGVGKLLSSPLEGTMQIIFGETIGKAKETNFLIQKGFEDLRNQYKGEKKTLDVKDKPAEKVLALPDGIKLTKVTEIDARKPKNKVTKKNNNKKSDSSSSDDTTSGGTPTGTNPTNNQGGTTDDTKIKKQPKKKTETKTKTTSKKAAVTDYINETPQNERGQMEEIEAEENLRNNETPQKDMIEETPKNKVTSKKAEATTEQEENQTSEHFSYKDYGEFMKKYEAAEKEINDRLDKQMDKERAEKMERFNELTKKEDKTDAEGDEMMKLAGELNNMSNKYDRLKEQEFNKKHPELVAEKQRQNEMFDRDWKAVMDKKMEEINKPFNNLRDKYLKELRNELGIADGVTLDSDFYNSLTPEQKKMADEINKEYAEKYEELRQKMASVKTIEESKAKITKNKKNKVTNSSKVKESGLFNENEVDKGNKSEGLNPDALPLSDYREMQRLNDGYSLTSLSSALSKESLKDYMANKIANEKIGVKPDFDDNEAWDKLPEDFEDDWEAVASDIEEMYDAYEEYLDMKNGGDTFDENTLKNTLESANFYANRQFPGKTAKEVIDQYTPQYESDLKIYNKLIKKYPSVFANGKIDLTGAEGKARRELANQENETAQDIDYQELAERENETPQVEDEELNTSPLDLEFESERRTAEELDENETPQANEEEMNKATKRQPEKPKNLVTSKKEDNFMEEQAKSFDTPEAFIESAISKDYKVGDNVKGLGTIQDVTDTQVKINGQRFAKKILGDNIDNVTLSTIRSTLDNLQAKNKDISDIISARKKGLYLLSFIQNSKNKQHLADIGYLEPVGDSSGAEGFTTAKSHMRDYANLKHGVENAEKQLREYWESVNKGNSEGSSTNEQQSEFETLPDDVTVIQEAKQLGAKRIAPDRVPRQQLTFDEGVNKIAENLETLAEYKKTRDEIYSPEGYNDGEVYVRYNNLKKEFQNIMYGNNGFQFKSNKSKEFTDLWKNIVDNKDNKTALREVAKNFYISKVKKDISKGYVYPQEVLDKIPGAKKAIDNRERYEKGLNTSFSAKDERIDYSEKDKIGAGMKSQDGKQITKEQKEDIVKGILDFGKTLGLDMKKFAEDRGLVYVHLHGGLAFLNNMAAGLYRESTNEQGEKNISVSVGGAENVRYKDPKTKERKTTTLNTTMSHELGHAMDYLLDNKLFSWTQKSILGSKYNPVNRLRKYYARGNEIVARAIEQYVAVENGQPNYYLENGNLDAGEFKGTDLEYALKEVGSYYERPGYWSKPDYEKYVKPYVEEAFKNNFEEYKINKSQKKNVLSNDKNKITSK